MSIYHSLYNELKTKIGVLHGYKQYANAWNMLDREGIADVIQDGNTFWFEFYQYGDYRQSELDSLKKYIKKHKGLKYLYDNN